MKYRVKFIGKIIWEKDIEIKDESDPYKEAEKEIEKLQQEDGFVDDAYIDIDKLKPLTL